jgi:hypothetical protein
VTRLITPRSRNQRKSRDRRCGEKAPSAGIRLARRTPAILTFGSCNASSRALSVLEKKSMPLTGPALDLARLGQAVERADAGGEVVERGEVGEIAPVAAEQDRAAKRVDAPEAVSAPSRRSIRL